MTNVVVRFAPFQRTIAPDTKPVPFTVSVNAGPPAAVLLGERDVNVAGVEADAPSYTMLPMDGTPLPLTMKSK